MGKQLFQHSYKNGIRIEITEDGFTVWDDKVGRWVIDGSLMATDQIFTLSSEIIPLKRQISFNTNYPVNYPTKKAKSKRVRRKK